MRFKKARRFVVAFVCAVGGYVAGLALDSVATARAAEKAPACAQK